MKFPSRLSSFPFPLLLDGATGTELVRRGMPAGVCPEQWCLEHPEAILDAHRAYREAGSCILYAPTFGANRLKMAEFGLADKTAEIAESLVRLVRKQAGGALVFGDIASTGKFVEPYGDLPLEECIDIYRETAEAMVRGGADGLVIETMMDLQEARAAYLGARDAAPDLPIFVTMTFDASGRSLTGVHPLAALATFQALGADAFGCNCSTGPEDMAAILRELHPHAAIPLIAKPNAGVPRLENGKTVFPMSPEEFGRSVQTLADAGATIFGGCCGTTPEHIGAVRRQLQHIRLKPMASPHGTLLASPGSCRLLAPDAPFTLIGERINPTGKKALQAELRAGKTDMVFDFALQQQQAGAAVLDVNMGMAGISESEMMRKALARILPATALPLCIDSTDAATVETALRFYPGRAMLNSISCEHSRLRDILPLAAKYGAALLLLPLTDQGIPATAEERMEVVHQLLEAVAEFGYSASDVCVDPLIMAVSAQPDAANVALDVIRQCHAEGLNTVCGLSNVSFGLPNRPVLNRTFLSMAMGCGLNMAIANPLFPDIPAAIAAGDALNGKDLHQGHWVALAQTDAANDNQATPQAALAPEDRVKQAILQGNASALPAAIDTAIAAGFTATSVMNQLLIPAITEVGSRFERKICFLPQLLQAAEAMQAGTAYLEPLLEKEKPENAVSSQPVKLLFATVKGDIHDIGKNIVISMLRNCGFQVIDLGKDVPAQRIIDTAKREHIRIIGLSALMTTTMHSMRETIEEARRQGLNDVTFLVGGAVVDQAFAREIRAVYCADPMATLRAVQDIQN